MRPVHRPKYKGPFSIEYSIIITIIPFKAVHCHATNHDPNVPKYKGPFSIDYRERGSHAKGVYSTQYTSRKGTVRVKHEEETKTITQQSSKKSERKERGHEGEKLKTRPN